MTPRWEIIKFVGEVKKWFRSGSEASDPEERQGACKVGSILKSGLKLVPH
jgi:hypothetical protein